MCRGNLKLDQRKPKSSLHISTFNQIGISLLDCLLLENNRRTITRTFFGSVITDLLFSRLSYQKCSDKPSTAHARLLMKKGKKGDGVKY